MIRTPRPSVCAPEPIVDPSAHQRLEARLAARELLTLPTLPPTSLRARSAAWTLECWDGCWHFDPCGPPRSSRLACITLTSLQADMREEMWPDIPWRPVAFCGRRIALWRNGCLVWVRTPRL